MPSESSKKREQQKKARAIAKRKGTAPAPGHAPLPSATPPSLVCTGDLAHADKFFKDIEIQNLTLSVDGEDVITNSSLNLQYGSFYGIVPSAGGHECTLFTAMAQRLLPFPSHFDVCGTAYNPEKGHMTVLKYVTSHEDVTEQIEIEKAKLASMGAGDSEAMQCLNKRTKAFEKYGEEFATRILTGLGFDKEMQMGRADSLHSSWEKPLSLARTLYLRPQIILIDEPTHFLDLERSLWLAKWLSENLKNKCIVVIKSNDEDFVTEMCTEFLHVKDCEVQLFNGSYQQFLLSKEVFPAVKLIFRKPLNKNLPPLYIQLKDASFGYSDDKLVFEKVQFDITLGSKIAFVGSKGSGKSTLLNMLRASKDLTLTEGNHYCNPKLSVGYFHAKLIEELDTSQSPLDHILRSFQGQRALIKDVIGLEPSVMRKPMRELSNGQKTLVVLACLSLENHDILLIDEPCEDVDVETVDSIGTALASWKGTFVLASNNLKLIDMVSCVVWVTGSLGLMKHTGDIRDLKRQMQEHNEFMADLQNPKRIRGHYPQFAITNMAHGAHPTVYYDEYIDGLSHSYKSGCIPFADFIFNRAMVANAPCRGLDKGEMDFPFETDPNKTYRMTTDPGRRICRSLFGTLHYSVVAGECFSDFDISNLMVTTNGTVRLKGVKRKRLCQIQLRRNHMSAHKIVKDMCSVGGAVPEDVQHLLDMIENEPDMAPIYHIHYCVVPICALAPFFTKLFEQLMRYMSNPALKEQILLKIPYLGTDQDLIAGQRSGLWHQLAQSNLILLKTYSFVPALFNLQPLLVLRGHTAITPRQLKERRILEAKNLLDTLRNRVAHRMDYNNAVLAFQYAARASDLAAHARFAQVACVMQKELHKANQTVDLGLDEFSHEKV